MSYDVIVDCYTDEPSGLGVPPYLGVHSRYIAGALAEKKRDFYYLTVDDLRYSDGEIHSETSFNKRILNITKNKNSVRAILSGAENVYVVMGCFVKYEYVSAEPPSFEEVGQLLGKFTASQQHKVLFYALGGSELSRQNIRNTVPQKLFNEIIFGNTYNYFLGKISNKFSPNYEKLKEIAKASACIMAQLDRPLVIEIETATGCNRNPGCTFCIEGMRGLPLQFRSVEDVVEEIKALYVNGARYFRLGKQPNFYAYMNSNPDKVEDLLRSIREACPEIRTLHIDNVSPHNVPTAEGEKITEIVSRYCTDGNIGPFGVESFDAAVREKCNLNGTIDQIHQSVEILNKYGKVRGDSGMPKFLPGINIIYGLDGQTSQTLQDNLDNFKKILDSGNLVRRVFVRKLTSPFGEQFDQYSTADLAEFKSWQDKIEKDFIVPMLKKTFPLGLNIKNLRMEMYSNGDSMLRQLGTCPVRVVIRKQKLKLDSFYQVEVVGYIGNRTIIGKII